jgi:hypothetical protein
MWPFTSRRIFGNRWWAVGFVLFVCYQAVDFIDSAPDTDNTATTDISGAPISDGQLNNAEEALKSM